MTIKFRLRRSDSLERPPVMSSGIARNGDIPMMPTAGKSPRIPALDFTKGALVLFMVLYHWLNYFVATQGEFYRYLRFVTPSFIFITGFLVSNVYLPKYEIADTQLPKRLTQRGLKILGLFIFLNLTVSFLFSESYNGKIQFDPLSITNMLAIYVTGNADVPGIGKAAAFHILVPISYVLLLSAALLSISRFYRYTFHVICMFSLLGVFFLRFNDYQSANLELLTVGLLGVTMGYVPIETINKVVGHPYMVVAAYLGYAGAITVWGVGYPLQVVGLFPILLLIYLVGARNEQPGRIRRHIILLGKYSLFGYIAQIAVLQLIFRALRHVQLEAGAVVVSFLGAFALTMLTVTAVDRVRARSSTMDRLYKIVFA
jgi:peptidoglycan/LPS O-acetylase OafA/YrhL